MPDEEIYSCRVPTGRRTYFFDLKQSANGDIYLVISESRLEGSDFRHSRVLVDEEYIDEFAEGFREVLGYWRGSRGKKSGGQSSQEVEHCPEV